MNILTIGRDANNEIVLDNNFVSRRHAQLIISDNGQVLIKDLGSSNGTFVNGNKVTESHLKPGDMVKCADIHLNWLQYTSNRSVPPNSFSQPHPPVAEAYSSPGPQGPSNAQRPHDPQLQNPNEKKLYISSGTASDLPSMVRNELATLSAQKQAEFLEEYNRRKKSIALAYIFLIIIFCVHYGYLRKWGLQFLFWFTGGGFLIWWFVDLFRTYGMVQDYNKDIAVEVMRNFKAISN